MKYLIINEKYTKGGTEVQSLREKNNFEKHGDDVLYITFDDEYDQTTDTESNHINIDMKYNKFFKKIFRLFEDKRLTQRIRDIITDFQPDYIHINNTTDHAFSIFKAVNGYKVFQTIRDYSAVCPTGFCVDKKWNICEGRNCKRCISKCMPNHNRIMFLYYYFINSKIYKYRKKYITQFACPSEMLTEYCNRHSLNTECINNPFDFSVFDNINFSKPQNKVYLYYGFIAEHKGIMQLLAAYSKFCNKKDTELWIIGECQVNLVSIIKKYEKDYYNIKYFGKLPYKETLNILGQVYAVIVPSLWMENYPNTVLEGLCAGKIVLASDRGGMKEMIRDDNLIFDVMDQKDIIKKLNYSYYLTESEYNGIAEKNIHYVQENNNLDVYYNRIRKLVSCLSSGE